MLSAVLVLLSVVAGAAAVSLLRGARSRRATLAEDRARALEAAHELAGIGNWELQLSTGALRWSSDLRRLFALPDEDKLKLKIDRNFRGYLPFNASTIVTSTVAKVSKPNQSESLMFMHEVRPDDPAVLAGEPLQGPNQWPDETLLPGFLEGRGDDVDCVPQPTRETLKLPGCWESGPTALLPGVVGRHSHVDGRSQLGHRQPRLQTQCSEIRNLTLHVN